MNAMHGLLETQKPRLPGCTYWPLLVLALIAPWASAQSKPEIAVPYFDSSLHPIFIDGDGADWPADALTGEIVFYAGDGNEGYASVYGTTRTLITRLKTWSGQEGLAQFTAKGPRGYGYYRIDSQEKLDAFKGELTKLKAWWKEKEGEFKFPAGAVDPAEADPPVKVKKVEQF